MKNCNLDTLLCNKLGFASLCTCCDTVHLGFGNFLVTVANIDLLQFSENMRYNLMRRNAASDNPMIRNIVIPTPAKEVSLLFCLNELAQFVDFLEQVQSKLVIKKLLNESINPAIKPLN
ncbi:MAG: hypothetical protein GC192_14145 [Bacteroidetes bacterium]|nr:hypothetical protein [Bacteroidota bacterium]